jgi:hypothetical protein
MMAIFLGNAVFVDCAVCPEKYPDQLAAIRASKGPLWRAGAGASAYDGTEAVGVAKK